MERWEEEGALARLKSAPSFILRFGSGDDDALPSVPSSNDLLTKEAAASN